MDMARNSGLSRGLAKTQRPATMFGCDNAGMARWPF